MVVPPILSHKRPSREVRLNLALCVKSSKDMSKRRDNIRRNVGVFLKQYRRKAHAGHDPNDRRYSRDMEKRIKSMNPEELSEAMAGEDENILLEEEDAWFSGENPVGVLYSLNQVVRVDLNKTGSVISLIRVRPEPIYLVELTDGSDVEVYQSRLSEYGT